MSAHQSPRQELGDFVESMRLRDAVERYGGKPSDEAIDLLVRVVSRYCSSRNIRTRRSTPRNTEP